MEMYGHPVRAQVKVANLDNELALRLSLSAGIRDSHPLVEALAERLPHIAEEISAALDRSEARRAKEDEGGYDDGYEVGPPPPAVEHVFSASVLSNERHRLRVWPCPPADRPLDATPALDLIGVEFGVAPKSALVRIDGDRVGYRVELMYPMRSIHATGSDLAAIHGDKVYVDLQQLQVEADAPGFERQRAGAQSRQARKRQGRLPLSPDTYHALPAAVLPPPVEGGGQAQALPGVPTPRSLPAPEEEIIDAELVEEIRLTTIPPETAGDALAMLVAQGGMLAEVLDELTGPQLMAWIRVVEGNPDAKRTSKERAIKRLCKAADEARQLAA